MLHGIDLRAERPRHRVFAVSAEDFIERTTQRRRQRAVIPRPQPRHARLARLFRHAQNFVALLEVKRKPDYIPATPERFPVFPARRVFEDLYARHVLPQKPQPKRNPSRHAKPPGESLRRILAEIVV